MGEDTLNPAFTEFCVYPGWNMNQAALARALEPLVYFLSTASDIHHSSMLA